MIAAKTAIPKNDLNSLNDLEIARCLNLGLASTVPPKTKCNRILPTTSPKIQWFRQRIDLYPRNLHKQVDRI